MKETKIATFGGGCFWCTEAVFRRIDGVVSVTSGYAGGTKSDPSYEAVCTGATGHAEVIQIEYRPEEIDYKRLLEIFWNTHDPTTLNQQGADVGTQYRSIVLYHDEEQKNIAIETKNEVEQSGKYSRPIVTEIVPLSEFYPAEEYHQDYFKKNPQMSYCRFVIQPKLEKLRLS
jgi:peptide-methionine (S)-S-oxide reductase